MFILIYLGEKFSELSLFREFYYNYPFNLLEALKSCAQCLHVLGVASSQNFPYINYCFYYHIAEYEVNTKRYVISFILQR